jgi:hypothetical protein
MSERGSFITEYIYCDKCFEACKEVLCGNDKYLLTRQIAELPIIAGKIGGMYPNEEIVDMEDEYIPKIQEKMCPEHKIRIAIMAEQGQSLYVFDKKNIENLIPEEKQDFE